MLSPFDCGGTGVADAALNLARSLDAAPASELPLATALRRQLISVAIAVAENWRSERTPVETERSFRYHKLIWKLREVAADLGMDPRRAGSPSGIQITMEALCDRFLPNSVAVCRPASLAAIVVREQLQSLRERLAAIDLTEARIPEGPHRFLVVRYPAGEQDNVLMACTALPYFHEPRMSHVFAAAQAGPAYFFAVAAEIQNNKGFSETFDPPKLCFIGELLEIAGWLEHPQVGPLIERWRAHFEFTPDYLDRRIDSDTTLKKMRETQEAFRTAPPGYTPADYDRDVPLMLDRLRRGICPIQSTPERDAMARGTELVSVLNAGWSFAQLYLHDLYEVLGSRTADERYEARQILNGLLAEGIHRSSAAG